MVRLYSHWGRLIEKENELGGIVVCISGSGDSRLMWVIVEERRTEGAKER